MFSTSFLSSSLFFFFFLHYTAAQTYTATYLPSNAPDHSENGQTGTNRCSSGYNQSSDCQNAYVNSVQDWCVWGPPHSGANSAIGDIERIAVAYCIKTGYGTRLVPDGTVQGAHFVRTPDFVQITGVGNFINIGIPAGDAGGELDPHGADGNGNPIGGLVFSNAFGPLQQIHEWTNFMSDSQFCFRACKPGPLAPTWCQHVYDIMGCAWNMPANYNPGVFEDCLGDSGEPMGVYGSSTFYQGQPGTPPPHPAPSSSSCTTYSSISNGLIFATPTTSSSTATTTSVGVLSTATAPTIMPQPPPSSGSSLAAGPAGSFSSTSNTGLLTNSAQGGYTASTSGPNSSSNAKPTPSNNSGAGSKPVVSLAGLVFGLVWVILEMNI